MGKNDWLRILAIVIAILILMGLGYLADQSRKTEIRGFRDDLQELIELNKEIKELLLKR